MVVGKNFLRAVGSAHRSLQQSPCWGKISEIYGIRSRFVEEKLVNLEFRIASFLSAKRLDGFDILLLDSGHLIRGRKCGWLVYCYEANRIDSGTDLLRVYEQCRRKFLMTCFVSITGFVGHAVREAKKILNMTRSSKVVVVSGRSIWSRYKF